MSHKKIYPSVKTYAKRKYDYRKANHLCTDCGIPLPEKWQHVRCADCMEVRRKARKKPQHRKPRAQHGPAGTNYRGGYGQWWTYVEEIPRGKLGEPVTCHGCWHRIKFDGWSICNYCHDMHTPRPCPVEGCTEYRQSPRGKRHTIETTAQRKAREEQELKEQKWR